MINSAFVSMNVLQKKVIDLRFLESLVILILKSPVKPLSFVSAPYGVVISLSVTWT